MWIWYSQLCCCFNIFLVMWIWCLQLYCCFWFILVMWIWYSQLCCCFNFILVMWIWYSQLCCFWFYSGHVNLIFTALLLFLILFWSCESDIHNFAVVFDFYYYHVSHIHNFAVVFNFHLVSESDILSFAVIVHDSCFSLVRLKNCHEWHAQLLGRKYLSDIYYCYCVFNACVALNKLPFDCILHWVFYMIRFVSFVTMDKIKAAFNTLLDLETV